MGNGRNARRRKATLIAFSLVALSSVLAHDVQQSHSHSEESAISGKAEFDHATDASNAYAEAMQILQSLHQPVKPQTPFSASKLTPSFIRSLVPNARGPMGSVVRVANRIRNHRWIPRWLSGKMDRIKDDSSPSWSLFKTSGRDSSSEKALQALELLERASELGHHEAMYTLADLSLFPPSYTKLPINSTRAFNWFYAHADATGNSTSQAHVAFFYASGYSPSGTPSPVEIDQAKALLWYTFAAHGGNSGAAMVLGYRNWAGISVNENCQVALDWYQTAAEASMAHFLTGPPGGRTLPRTSTRISDLDGGVFGPGASVASTGLNAFRPVIKAAKSRGTGETWDDLLEFYKFHADRDEVESAFKLGKIYYQGSIYNAPGGIGSGAEGFGALPRDFVKAKAYLLKVARHVWPAQSPPFYKNSHLTKKENIEDKTLLHATWAAGYLGRMYLRGEGVKQDFATAKIWFERGAEYNEKECLNGLAIIWRDGLVDKKVDEKRANEYFQLAAGQDLAEAQTNIGKAHYKRGEYGFALKYFETAIRHGSPFEAFYYMASIHAARVNDPASSASLSAGSCGVAVSFFKLVAERGNWRSDLVGEAEEMWLGSTGSNAFVSSGNSDFGVSESSRGSGDGHLGWEKEGAKLRWWIAAEQGFEIAQNNLAYVLDQHKSLLPLPKSLGPNNQTARDALIQWTRSAAQHDVDALVKVGDYYYHGLGVENESQELLWEKAAGYYLSAVETQRSALAMWNLGWMYESGRGVAQDYHLAKRYYDLALETNHEAYLPVILSLIKLYLKSLWYTLSGGKEKGLTLWGLEGEEETHSFFGLAREEWTKRWRTKKIGSQDQAAAGEGATAAEEVDDPVEWAENKKAEEIARARAEEEAYERGDFFSGDFLAAGDARRQQQYDEDGRLLADTPDDFWETMFLVALCIAISALIFVRGRFAAQAEARRRNPAGATATPGANGAAQQPNHYHTTPQAPNGILPQGQHQPARRDEEDQDRVVIPGRVPNPQDDILPDIGLFPPGEEPPDL